MNFYIIYPSELGPYMQKDKIVLVDIRNRQEYMKSHWPGAINMEEKEIKDIESFLRKMPQKLVAHTGMDAMTHAIEAYVSNMASDYTDGLAEKAVELVFGNLKQAYEYGEDKHEREKMHNASCIAGMAFTNAFLGVCHSMAHKLGAFHHIPHGIANALMIEEVLRFNSVEVPTKMGTFPQYDHPQTLRRYAQIAEALGINGKNDNEKLEKKK